MEVREIKLKFKVFVEQDDDGSMHAYCPDLKGVHVYGDDVEEALRNVRTAVELHLSSVLKHDHAIPVGILSSDIMHGSFSAFLWSCAKNKLKQSLHIGGRTKSFVEEISIPPRLASNCI